MEKRTWFLILLVLVIVIGCDGLSGRKNKRDLAIYERIALERTDDIVMEEFIDSLLGGLTLVEKVGQMTQVSESFFDLEEVKEQGSGNQAAVVDTAKVAALIREFQVGSFLTGGKRIASEWVEVITMLQDINLKNSKSRIPVIFGIDHVHGTNYLSEGTIFPHEINIAATFNEEHANKMGAITALEAAALGHHWNFAPVLDIGRNKLWPRLFESFGEDTYLASVMGASYIRGVQETRVGLYRMAACAKHFLGYSYTQSGWDRGAAEISPQGLQEFQVPPFYHAVKAGVLSVMINSGEINGVPVHASHYYLTDMLRGQLDFKGVAITDYLDIIKLHTEHFVTVNEKESTYTAIMAGIDMSMTPTTIDFCRHLVELVEEGRIPEERIDLSVRRILRMKYMLGLFNTPFPSMDYSDSIGSAEAITASVKAAGESIVLMKNERRLLPLIHPNRLVVAGMNANLKMALCGGWTYSWQGNNESFYPDSVKTVYQALKNEFERSQVILSDKNSIKNHAQSAQAIIIVTGEQPYAEGWGNIDDLALEKGEQELIATALETGKPVILILLEGRPRILGELYDRCNAVLFAGLPGMFGADAIAGILAGRINPSARMPFTYPYKSGHIIPYNYKPMEFSYLNVYNKNIQRFTIGEFGTGLSYTTFEYSGIQLSDTIVKRDGTITAKIVVTNTGQREGYEPVLWFLSDEIGSYTRTVKQLKHFEKQFILPGEIKEYSFVIDPWKHLVFPNENGKILLEDGYFTLLVGNQKARFSLIPD